MRSPISAALPDQLVEPLPGHHALAISIDIHAAVVARCRAVDRHTESDGSAVRGRSQDEMEVPGVESAAFTETRPVDTVVVPASVRSCWITCSEPS